MFIKNKAQETGKDYILDKPAAQETFLQFVPATVKHIINSGEHAASSTNNNNESNCIAIQRDLNTEGVNIEGLETKKYRPLIRGFSDSVVKGDSVLVTIVGNTGYYLGPLNTSNTPSSTKSSTRGASSKWNTALGGGIPPQDKSKTYPYDSKFNRLVKEFNVDLDDPDENNKRIKSPVTGNPILTELHTDMMLEGRHGNSIRIGSRNRFPNVIIDNGRGTNQSQESINDSSIFGMFHQGSILQHFRPEIENLDNESYLFKLGDESIESPINYIKSTFTAPLGRGQAIDGEADSDIEDTIYGYSGAFSILNSDRIILNARKENMYISAFNHLHLGSGNSLTFSTSKNTIFNSTERFDINAPEVRLGSQVDEDTQPIVLGDNLVTKLTELCEQLDGLISNITSITVTTTQGPSGTPINAAAFNAQTQGIKGIADSLEEFLSLRNRTT